MLNKEFYTTYTAMISEPTDRVELYGGSFDKKEAISVWLTLAASSSEFPSDNTRATFLLHFEKTTRKRLDLMSETSVEETIYTRIPGKYLPYNSPLLLIERIHQGDISTEGKESLLVVDKYPIDELPETTTLIFTNSCDDCFLAFSTVECETFYADDSSIQLLNAYFLDFDYSADESKKINSVLKSNKHFKIPTAMAFRFLQLQRSNI